jgi:hypothetical protein
MDILRAWAESTTIRMQPGGDLHRQPRTREQMAAPLSRSEQQLAAVHRYGVLEDGTIGWVRIPQQ